MINILNLWRHLLTTAENEESYRLINSAHITRVEGDLSTTTLPNLSEFGTSIHALEKKEITALENAEKSIRALNFNVSPEIQALYDRLLFMYVLLAETLIVANVSVKSTLTLPPPRNASSTCPHLVQFSLPLGRRIQHYSLGNIQNR